jgi:hypothetical protein
MKVQALLDQSRRAVEALRKRTQRLQKNIRRLYESREAANGNPRQPPRNPDRD